MKSSYGDMVSVALDGRHVAIVVIDAPPHNFVNVEMIRSRQKSRWQDFPNAQTKRCDCCNR